MKKNLISVFIISVCLFVLIGCGGDNIDEPELTITTTDMPYIEETNGEIDETVFNEPENYTTEISYTTHDFQNVRFRVDDEWELDISDRLASIWIPDKEILINMNAPVARLSETENLMDSIGYYLTLSEIENSFEGQNINSLMAYDAHDTHQVASFTYTAHITNSPLLGVSFLIANDSYYFRIHSFFREFEESSLEIIYQLVSSIEFSD